jgi:hypothetical protein
MKRRGELVLRRAALEIVAALGIRSLQSAAVIHLGPRRTGTEPGGLVGNLVCESDVTGLRLGLHCSQGFDSKAGRCREWSIEHAWKSNPLARADAH